ncbi:hypothetical protein V8G54_019688 [Vigna mungo]|uniref:Protein ARV n=1 Tax=Vigna mungo TaxID=3915 RepID=A0AAQ3NAX7_VIGMU
MDYKCIQCGCPVKTLYVQYSPGNIRLMKCENCRAVADEYIECEIMILVIDLILHKLKAYRHLLHNVINQKTMKFQIFSMTLQGLLWKLAIVFLLFEAHRCLILESGKGKMGSSISFSSLVSICLKVWEFPSSVIFIIELFCLSSNAVALKVMTESTMSRCVWTCFFAYAIKFLVTQILELILLGKSKQGWSQISSSFFKSA